MSAAAIRKSQKSREEYPWCVCIVVGGGDGGSSGGGGGGGGGLLILPVIPSGPAA